MSAVRRTPAQITFSTWKALFLRISVARLSTSRLAWFWLLFEPVAFTVLLMLVFTFMRVRHIGGISTAVWIMAGILAFLMFRRTASQAMMALASSKPLFTYPQIRPLDPVVVNGALEGFLMVLVAIVLLAGASLFDYDVVPQDPLAVLEALFGLWLLGLGYGLAGSALREVFQPASVFLSFLLRPLYFLSGVLFPVLALPYPYRDWLLLNPLVHGLEAARRGFASYYHVPPEISVAYLYGWAVIVVFLGLALHVRYRHRLGSTKK